MRIRNLTPYRTNHLRAFVARVAKDELDAAQRKELRVTFRTKIRRGWRRQVGTVSGIAYVGDPRAGMTIYLTGSVDRRRLAHTLAHEMAHVRGMRHPMMRRTARYGLGEGWDDLYAYAETLPLERKATPTKPSATERRSEKLERARALLTRWERRAKQAAGKVGRWRGRVRTLERTVAIAAMAAQEISDAERP